MKKQMNSRKDAVTKDMVVDDAPVLRTYSFPKLRVSVQADSYESALAKAKEIISKKKVKN